MGTVQIDGSTPKLTIGNATAEDATILFDGNAQDFYIALDDSADDLLIGKGSTVGTTPAIAIDENLKVNIPVTTASTSASTGSLTTGGGAGIGADLYVGDDVYLITDSAVLGFGADKDTLLTHTDGTGLTLNSTNKLCFNDATQFIQGASGTVLDIAATDEIELTSTLVEVVGRLEVTNGVIFNEASDNTVDFRVESATDANCLIVDGSGDRVGMGVAVPEAKLHVFTGDASIGPNGSADELVIEGSGHTAMSILSGASSQGGLYFGDSGDDNIAQFVYDHSDNSMQWVVNTAEVMRFDSAGRLLLATTSYTAGASSGHFVITFDASATNAIKTLDTDGNATGIHNIFVSDDAAVGTIKTSTTATSFNTSSDYRLKENETAITDGITRIKQLKPYRFNFKKDPDTIKDGFFAHEVSSIVPEAISGEKDAMAKVNYTEDDAETQDAVLYTAEDELPEGKERGDVKTSSTKKIGDFKEYHETEIDSQEIDQAKLVPLLVAAVKELTAKVEALEG